MITTKKSITKLSFVFGTFIIAGLIFVSCSKQRITQDSYSPMDAFYDENQQQEQEFTINRGDSGNCLITGKMGTRLFSICDSSMFRLNGSTINYPYTVRLTEVYPVKDMILSRVPSVAGGSILESEAELRVRAFQGANQLTFLNGRHYGIAVAPINPLMSGAQVYYGRTPTGFMDWSLSSDPEQPDSTGTFNIMAAGKLDWVQSAKQHQTTAAYTTIKINAVGNNTDNIDVYIVFKNFKSVMKVYKLQSGQVPIGENVTVIAMALNQNNDYLLHKEDISVASGQQITLAFKTVSKADLLSTLGGL